MRTLLRHASTGQYIQSLQKWTPDPDDAHDFRTCASAVRFVRKAGLPNMEVTLTFGRMEPVRPFYLKELILGRR